ncbi:MAG: GNAT family N-acetyltransferase [Dongiaceae bacterium]
MAEIIFRPFVLTDAAAVLALHNAALSNQWHQEDFLNVLAQGNCFGVAACRQNAIIGAVLAQQAQDHADILTLVVEENSRRQGIGAHLLTAFLAAARQAGIKNIFLEVAVTNNLASRLYEKLGFICVGQRPGYYQEAGQQVDAKIYHLINS